VSGATTIGAALRQPRILNIRSDSTQIAIETDSIDYATRMQIVTTDGRFRIVHGTSSALNESISIYQTGRVSIGAIGIDNGYQLDVLGTTRVSDNLTVSKNQNAQTKLILSNITSGASANPVIEIVSSGGLMSISKYSSTTTSYKILSPNDALIYNGTSGDIAIFNDIAGGNIKLAAGGSSTSHLTINSNGSLLAASNVTASSAIARGVNLTPTLVASANNDVLVGLDVNPTFTNGAFTGVRNIGLRSQWKAVFTEIVSVTGGGPSPGIDGGNGLHFNFSSNIATIQAVQTGVTGRQLNIMGYPLNFGNSNSGTLFAQITSTGSLILQNGGTFTDAGFRLDVNGLVRFQDSLLVTKNQNDLTNITVSNTTSGIAAGSMFSANIAANNFFQFGKFSSGTTASKIVNPNDGFIYNRTAGDIAILNDFASGSIKFAAGGSSTVHMTIKANGSVRYQPMATPGTAEAGDVYYDSTTNKLRCYNGTSWNDLF
jgi:hypothetical protein